MNIGNNFTAVQKLTSIKDFERYVFSVRLQHLRYYPWFRGHSLTSYLLKPNITRNEHTVETLIEKECQELERLKHEISVHELGLYPDNPLSYRNEWLLLMQAQHLGYATRLMDWTLNLRVALYFAVENEKCYDEDGHLCILLANAADIWSDQHLSNMNPKNLSRTVLINPSHFAGFCECLGERRRTLQMGKFSTYRFIRTL